MDEVSVLFSGGSDSTLAAVKMCERFEKVHLLTYHHSAMFYVGKSKVNVNKLKRRCGEDKVIHRIISIDKLFQSILYGDLTQRMSDIKKYGTYLSACFCGACKLAMHARTVIYNLENGIRFSRDGANKGSVPFFPDVICKKELKDFYKQFGIDYESPIWEYNGKTLRSDEELFKLGITRRKHLKFPAEIQLFSTQHSCLDGFHHIYVRGYYLPVYGAEAFKRISVSYYKDKMEICKKYVHKYFKRALRLRAHEGIE